MSTFLSLAPELRVLIYECLVADTVIDGKRILAFACFKNDDENSRIWVNCIMERVLHTSHEAGGCLYIEYMEDIDELSYAQYTSVGDLLTLMRASPFLYREVEEVITRSANITLRGQLLGEESNIERLLKLFLQNGSDSISSNIGSLRIEQSDDSRPENIIRLKAGRRSADLARLIQGLCPSLRRLEVLVDVRSDGEWSVWTPWFKKTILSSVQGFAVIPHSVEVRFAHAPVVACLVEDNEVPEMQQRLKCVRDTFAAVREKQQTRLANRVSLQEINVSGSHLLLTQKSRSLAMDDGQLPRNHSPGRKLEGDVVMDM